MGLGIAQIAIGIIAIIIAFAILKKIAKSIFFFVLFSGIFCISKGIIDIATIQQWITSIF